MNTHVLLLRAVEMQRVNQFNEAECLLRKALLIEPENVRVLHQLALCVREQARFSEAEKLLRRVLTLSSDNADALFDLSELEIRAGHYVQGWQHYEARNRLKSAACHASQVSSAMYWQGEALAGKSLALNSEQGNGDCLWAMRFLPSLAERARHEGGHVFLCHDGPLRHLLNRMQTVDMTLETESSFQVDFYCGMMSLPLRLGVADSKAWCLPYLQSDTDRAKVWQARVASAKTAADLLSVGLVWNGNPHQARDRHRSIPIEQLEPLLTVPGILFFALSPGRSEANECWREQGIAIVDLTYHFDAGFDDVAALMVNLDLVVTIDSGPAHLAGALGVPTYLMIDYAAAWYWGNQVGRAPWYGSVELFRQTTAGAWAPVLACVRKRLQEMVASL